MNPLNRTLLTVAAALALTVTTTSTAYAARAVHHDGQGDVVRFDEETDTPEPAPSVTQGDIKRTVVEHTAGNVVVKTWYVDLQRNNPMQFHYLGLVTNESVRRNLYLFVDPDHPQGQVHFEKGNGDPVACDGLTRWIDYALNTVRLKVPRSCLSGPRWVRAGYATFRITSGGATFADETYRTGAIGESGPRFGPRVARD